MIQEIIQSLIPMAAGWALATLWQGNEQIKARKKLQAILTEGVGADIRWDALGGPR